MTKDIQNMGYSLRTMVNLVGLIRGMNKAFLPSIIFFCDYIFLDAAAYFAAVKEYLLLNKPSKELKKHLETAKFLVDAMDSMEKDRNTFLVWNIYGCLAFSNDEFIWYNPFDTNDGSTVYYWMTAPMEWNSSRVSIAPEVNVEELFTSGIVIELLTSRGENCQYYLFSGYELFVRIGKILEEMEFLFDDEETDNKQPTKATITIPASILKKLAEDKFIEDATASPLKWLQNKQLARELLTDDKIRGSLSIAEIERRTPNTFVDNNGNPLKLAKPKKKDNDPNHKRLMKILATI